MTRWIAVAVAAMSVAAFPSRSSAQVSDPASVRIHVTDALSGEPLSGARVGFPDLELFSLTDSVGTAVIRSIPAGDHAFEVSMLGYGRASGLLHLEPGASGEDRIALVVQPFEIEGITVDGRQRWSTTLDKSGFYERTKVGFGRHLDRTDLRRRMGLRLDEAMEHLVRPRCGGGSSASGGGAATSFGNSGGPIATQSMGTTSAGPVVFLDGTLWLGGFRALGDIPFDWVEGVEIYNGFAGTPAQYAGWASCGVILIWTG